MAAIPGFLPMYWDAKQGKLYLEVRDFEKEFLYVVSLPAGLGSNDVGLDRGQLGAERIVRFERSGPRVLMVQPNYAFRALSANEDERRSVEEAFARSALWGFKVESEQDGAVLLDATAFFLRDAHGVIERLRATEQGAFKLDESRSAFYLPRTKGFPRNTEVEVTLTFTGERPGNFVRDVTPTPEAVTVRQRHSFVQLPEAGYSPREFDPRAGYSAIRYMDFATPIGEPIVKRFIARHRLSRDKPIVYYLDRGAPDPIRSALLDGARWWAEAFTAAGYANGFRVELLPEGADPMDVRFNVIQWVHRATRGWSYGSSVTDPRTGEIIKGHVTLGSLRVRQDFLIAEGLLAPYETGKPVTRALEEMALARLRQLSAHEVGHTLGLSHNYAASTVERASVMDYPHPLALLGPNGTVDLSKAYTTGIGEWDKVAIEFGYREFPRGTEREALNRIVAKAHDRGLYFIADADARAPGGAHPAAHLWDNGKSAVDELVRVLQVRERALERFGERNIRKGAPMSTIEEVLIPLYLAHRYQVEAAVKVVGGLNYRYALRGDGQIVTEMVPGAEQRRALQTVLKTIDPAFLALPEPLIRSIPPRPPGHPRHRETFQSRTGPAFDPVTAAEQAAGITIGLLLHPERLARLMQHRARNPEMPGADEIISAVLDSSQGKRAGLEAEIARRVNYVAVYHLMAVASAQRAAQEVRTLATERLNALKDGELGHAVRLFLEDPKTPSLPKPAEPPPGQPI